MSVLPERPRCDGLLDVKVIDDNRALKSVTWLSKERKVFLEASKKTVDNMQFSVTCAERESVHLEGISQSTSVLSDALDGIRMLWTVPCCGQFASKSLGMSCPEAMVRHWRWHWSLGQTLRWWSCSRFLQII